jgi:Ca2+/Na+ antiporter
MEIFSGLMDALVGKVSPGIAIGRALGGIVSVGLFAWLVWALCCRRRERDARKKG